MQIIIGADHDGFALKEVIKDKLLADGHTFHDIGAYKYDETDDYPDIASIVARAVNTSGTGSRGIVVCGTGVGATVAANKINGIRACLCHDSQTTIHGVEHEDMNVLCLGSQFVDQPLAFQLVNDFLYTQFIPNDLFMRRRNKVVALEKRPFGNLTS